MRKSEGMRKSETIFEYTMAKERLVSHLLVAALLRGR